MAYKRGVPMGQERPEIIRRMGGCCRQCGFSDIRALQIDHVNGGGSKEMKQKGYLKVYQSILDRLIVGEDVQDYQVLCANCNWIKRHENNEGPIRSDVPYHWRGV